jgi:phytoene synthase
VSAGAPGFDRAALVAHAAQVIARGSKSFAAASQLFDPLTRERVWLLYAWCRACDDIADAQEMGGELGDQRGAGERLALIRRLTALALAGEPGGHSSFDCLAVVARECGLTAAMAEDVIAGFALDAADWRPADEADLLQYCYHVAGAVGVMMAAVMGVSADDADTLDRACDLGIAFQLGNIARDLAEDDRAGRCYLPAQWLAGAGIAPGTRLFPGHEAALAGFARRLAALAADYEASARVGAARLPFRSRWAVLAAAGIYGAIARRVAARGPRAWEGRVRTGTVAKLGHVLGGLIACAGTPAPHPVPRWSRRALAERARARPIRAAGAAEFPAD